MIPSHTCNGDPASDADCAACLAEHERIRLERCTRCGQPIGLPAFRVATTDGERHDVCPRLEAPSDQMSLSQKDARNERAKSPRNANERDPDPKGR